MDELMQKVGIRAAEYWNDADENGQKIEKMPGQVVDFVVEYFFNSSNFPRGYTKERKIKEMGRFISSMAMACVEVYAKSGAEGQLSHSENGVSRSYKSAWISPELLRDLPNYVDFF